MSMKKWRFFLVCWCMILPHKMQKSHKCSGKISTLKSGRTSSWNWQMAGGHAAADIDRLLHVIRKVHKIACVVISVIILSLLLCIAELRTPCLPETEFTSQTGSVNRSFRRHPSRLRLRKFANTARKNCTLTPVSICLIPAYWPMDPLHWLLKGEGKAPECA